MSAEDKKRTMHKALVTRVLEGAGRASHVQRRAAFDNAGLTAPLFSGFDLTAVEQGVVDCD